MGGGRVTEEILQAMLHDVRGKSLPFAQHLLVYLKPIISGSHVEGDLSQF